MKHPLLQHRNGFLIYISSWVLFVAILFFIDWYFEGTSAYHALINSLSFSLPLLILAGCVWYVVRYTSYENLGLLGFLLHHLAAGIIVVGVWVSVAHQLRVNLFGIEHSHYIIPIHWQILFTFFVYDYLVMVYYLIIYYNNFKDKLLRESELKNLIKEAELTALKSQINPHFLFNSLNSVSSLTLSKPEQSREMVVKLSSFLRYSLGQDLKELNSLANEIRNIRLYLDIEKVRFGDRLVLNFNMSSCCENAKIPNLILQPLYENAIKYGVHESLEPVTISTVCSIENDNLRIEIRNNFDPESVPSNGNGIGLQNIKDRLRLIYGRNDLIKIKKTKNQFVVNLEFPQNK
nr:histidine kinase [uncultured Marinifilum sp.]